MNIYKAEDTYRGVRKFFKTQGEANFAASILISELEWGSEKDMSDWVTVECLNGKQAILDQMNAMCRYNCNTNI